MATTAESLEQLGNILNDPENIRWSSPECIAALNAAQRDFCARTGLLRTVATLVVEPTQDPNTAFYTMPADMLELTRLTEGGRQLARVESVDLGDLYETQTGTPDGYIFGEYGPLLVRLWPYPETATTTLKAYYVRVPTDLAENDPEIPDTWAPALAYGAAALLFLKDFEGSDSQKASVYRGLYEQMVADCIKRSTRSFDRSPRTIRTSWW